MSFKTFMLIIIAFIAIESFIFYKSANASNFNDAKRVFARLQNVCGYHVILSYDDDTNSNAFTDANHIIINEGMLQVCQNDDQLAMVLGHELGHYIKQHFRNKESMADELTADQLGYNLCKKAGYKKCKSFITHIRDLDGEDSGDGIHPGWTYRLKHLKGSI